MSHKLPQHCESDPNASKPKCVHNVPYSEPCAVCDVIIRHAWFREDGGRTHPERLTDGPDDDESSDFALIADD